MHRSIVVLVGVILLAVCTALVAAGHLAAFVLWPFGTALLFGWARASPQEALPEADNDPAAGENS